MMDHIVNEIDAICIKDSDEGGVASMDVDGGNDTDALSDILSDDESDDDLFDVEDEKMEDTDDELEDMDEEVEKEIIDENPIHIRKKGYKPEDVEGQLSEDSKAILFWRDGEENFGDWKINVNVLSTKNNEDGEDNCEHIITTTTYHVSKIKIARGPNKSDYFAALLSSNNFSESVDNTSSVDLPGEVAAHFPDFLDYIYSMHTESASVICFKNWKSMRWLANYFQVSKLLRDVISFIEKDLYNLDHMEDYISELHNIAHSGQSNFYIEGSSLLAMAARICAEMLLSIEPGSSLANSIPPRMFLKIISYLTESSYNCSYDVNHHINCLILEYLEHNVEEERYFHTLSNIVGLRFFDSDIEFAGQEALDWFRLMGKKGWKDYWFNSICAAYLQRYLSSHEPSTELMERVVEEVPNDIVAHLYREALLTKKTGRKGKINGLKFQVTYITDVLTTLECPNFDIIGHVWELPPMESTYSVSFLKIKIAYILTIGRSIPSRSWEMILTRNGAIMDGGILASYDFHFSEDEAPILVSFMWVGYSGTIQVML